MPAREVAPVIFFNGLQQSEGRVLNPTGFVIEEEGVIQTSSNPNAALHPSQRGKHQGDDLAGAAGQVTLDLDPPAAPMPDAAVLTAPTTPAPAPAAPASPLKTPNPAAGPPA